MPFALLPLSRNITARFCTCLLIALLAAWPLRGTAWGKGRAARQSAPEIRVEYFGAEQGVAVGGNEIVFLCVARNIGDADLKENALRLRLFVVAGLEYTSGDTTPTLPALATNQAVAYRWRLRPSSEKGPIVAGLLFERLAASAAVPAKGAQGTGNGSGNGPGGPRAGTAGAQPPADTAPAPVAPSALLAVVPRLPAAPRLETPPAVKNGAPVVVAKGDTAWVGNDRVMLKVLAAERRQPALLLAARVGAGWKTVALASPLAQVLSAEEGQKPWWETFRWRQATASAGPDEATLTLQGTFGARWQAQLIFTAQRDTGAVQGLLRLTARQEMRCFAVHLPRFFAESEGGATLKADGSGLAVSDSPSALEGDARLTAARRFGVTFGLAWPSATPVEDGWRFSALPPGDGDRALLLGAQAASGPSGTPAGKGVTLEIPFRLFVLAPSETIRDALRFQLP